MNPNDSENPQQPLTPPLPPPQSPTNPSPPTSEVPQQPPANSPQPQQVSNSASISPVQPEPKKDKKKLPTILGIIVIVVVFGLAAWFVLGLNDKTTETNVENSEIITSTAESSDPDTIVEWVNISNLSNDSNWDSGQKSGTSTIFPHKANSCKVTIQLATDISSLNVASQAEDANRLLEQVRAQSVSISAEINDELTFQGGEDPMNPDNDYLFEGKTLGYVGLDGNNYSISINAHWHNDRAMYVTSSCTEDDWFNSPADIAELYSRLRVFEHSNI